MRRALIVDDSRSIRNILANTLRGGGFEVFEAEDRKQAVAIVQSELLDVIITDLHMPDGDGIQLTSEIRALPSPTPIFILTTETSSNSRSRAKLAGATGWIMKPVRGTRLLEVIDQTLPRCGATENDEK